MCLACPRFAVLVALAGLLTVAGCAGARPGGAAPAPPAGPAAEEPPRVLRVAADPNNLPFSNDRLEGFENKIAELLAREMGAKLEYAWRAQRRGFFRHAFNDDGAQVVVGVPKGFDMALTTAPYYRSTYVFVYRADRGLGITSLDDPKLRDLKIGIQLVGDEGSTTPAGLALARRGLANNVVGYTVYGDYRQDNPPARVVEAVAGGEVDVAVVWGPLAGYFAKKQAAPLTVVPVFPEVEPPGLPFAFDISVGVKKGDDQLREELDGILARRRDDIREILDEYGVPRAHQSAEPTAQTRVP